MAVQGRKEIKWLYSELPELVSKGVLSRDAADSLQAHYGELPPSSSQKILTALFSILGSALVGGGIILVLAHNWEDLSRLTRTALSIGPLFVAQLLSLFAVVKRGQSTAWKESTALFQALMIGTSIALVSQTYHLSGNFRDFILTWMLLAVPLIYLIPSTLVMVFYLGAFMLWTFADLDIFEPFLRYNAWQYWLLFLLPLPAFARQLRQQPVSWRSCVQGYSVLLTLSFTAPYILQYGFSIWIVFYAGLTVSAYSLDLLITPPRTPIHLRPLYPCGTIGSYLLVFILSFYSVWNVAHYFNRDFSQNFPLFFAEKVLPAVLLYILAGVNAVRLIRRKADCNIALLCFPLVAGFAYIAGVLLVSPIAASLLINLYGLLLGIVTALRGIRSRSWTRTNQGLLLIAALVIARFFDSDFGLLQRGVVFVLLGIGLLAVNLHLLHRNKQATA